MITNITAFVNNYYIIVALFKTDDIYFTLTITTQMCQKYPHTSVEIIILSI